MSNSVDCLERFVASTEYTSKNETHDAESDRSEVLFCLTRKGSAAPQERINNWKNMLSVATSNLLTFSLKHIYNVHASASGTALVENTTKVIRSIKEKLSKASR